MHAALRSIIIIIIIIIINIVFVPQYKQSNTKLQINLESALYRLKCRKKKKSENCSLEVTRHYHSIQTAFSKTIISFHIINVNDSYIQDVKYCWSNDVVDKLPEPEYIMDYMYETFYLRVGIQAYKLTGFGVRVDV